MAWWGNPLSAGSFQPKQKSRFVVQLGNGGLLLSLSSVSKPTATIESKSFRMINHYYNYPGLVKWEPITLKFVDGKVWGDTFVTPGDENKKLNEKMTSSVLWRMLLDSGYLTPDLIPTAEELSSEDRTLVRTDQIRADFLSTPEKASTMDNSIGSGIFWIYQLSPKGKDGDLLDVVEAWEIKNPIITKISWGELSYSDDGLVEYSLDITYDWAKHYDHNPNKNN